MAPQSRGSKAQRHTKPHQSASSPNLLSLPTHQIPVSASPNRTPTGRVFPSTGSAESPPTQPLSSPLLSPDIIEDGAAEPAEAAYDEEDDDEDFLYHYSVHPSSSNSSSSSIDSVPSNPIPRRASLPYNLAGANPFAPPFYNRPPTPLPPSPSLTSLLRPTFSTTTSRPTTPDSSDVETPNDTEAAVAKSARTATTVPRASPKVPTYEYYGFVLYLVSSLAFRKYSSKSSLHTPFPDLDTLTSAQVMYLLWSYLPSPFLHQLGISYYPNRWWSLAIPSFLVMTIVYIYVALASYNTGYLTLPMESIENIVDEAANIAIINPRGRKSAGRRGVKGQPKRVRSTRKASGKPGSGYNSASGRRRDDIRSDGNIDWFGVWNKGTDAVMDIPVGGVCEILYGEGRETDDSDDEYEVDGQSMNKVPPKKANGTNRQAFKT
ncbi:MAG: hypothetical protein M4579_000110 [Chaenotheca gracillima]|nr:MAG: hypothetical protein M4579_000110 [Chaenotheca gracillima]